MHPGRCSVSSFCRNYGETIKNYDYKCGSKLDNFYHEESSCSYEEHNYSLILVQIINSLISSNIHITDPYQLTN